MQTNWMYAAFDFDQKKLSWPAKAAPCVDTFEAAVSIYKHVPGVY